MPPIYEGVIRAAHTGIGGRAAAKSCARFVWSFYATRYRSMVLGKLEFVELARKRHGFPRGEAVERSETDEERRNRPILHTVRKKGTI